jgi:acetolactate synthase-1/2/3 large subunit
MARVTKVSDYVIEFLKKSQVKNIFTVSGGGSMHLIDSIG